MKIIMTIDKNNTQVMLTILDIMCRRTDGAENDEERRRIYELAKAHCVPRKMLLVGKF